MARVGLSVRIDVTKIDKERLYKGEKGTYLDLTTFIDTENKDQYENNGFISQSVSKEEREGGVQTPILGNVRVIYQDGNGSKNSPLQVSIDEQVSLSDQLNELEDDIPF